MSSKVAIDRVTLAAAVTAAGAIAAARDALLLFEHYIYRLRNKTQKESFVISL